jgi:hypothetical protein
MIDVLTGLVQVTEGEVRIVGGTLAAQTEGPEPGPAKVR